MTIAQSPPVWTDCASDRPLADSGPARLATAASNLRDPGDPDSPEVSRDRTLLTVANLQVVLGGHPVLDDVSFELAAGQFLAVVGPNGAGKTTLLRVIAGLERRFTGRVDRRQLPPGTIGYLPQLRSFRRELPVQVLDVLGTRLRQGHGLFRRWTPTEKAAIGAALEEVGLPQLLHRPFGELSGGQQQRVLLARALLGPVRLLLLDEPETGLDHQAQHQFYELVQRLTRHKGLACLAVSHQLVTTAKYADLCLLLDRRVQAIGPGEEILRKYLAAGI